MASSFKGHTRVTCKSAINYLRKQGLKIGMVRPRWLRPWPTVQIASAFSKVKAIASVGQYSYGGATRRGNLIHELRATLYDLPKRPMVTSFMAGLGGDVVLLEDFNHGQSSSEDGGIIRPIG